MFSGKDTPTLCFELWAQRNEPLAGLFHQLTPSAFLKPYPVTKELGRSIYFAFRGSKWYARPVTLAGKAEGRMKSAELYHACRYPAWHFFILHSSFIFPKMAECRGLAPLARRYALVSTEARFACPVGIPKMVHVAGLAPATFPS